MIFKGTMKEKILVKWTKARSGLVVRESSIPSLSQPYVLIRKLSRRVTKTIYIEESGAILCLI